MMISHEGTEIGESVMDTTTVLEAMAALVMTGMVMAGVVMEDVVMAALDTPQKGDDLRAVLSVVIFESCSTVAFGRHERSGLSERSLFDGNSQQGRWLRPPALVFIRLRAAVLPWP